MSQFFVNSGSGGGGGNVDQVNTQSGNAIPINGILSFNAYDTTENNIFGIETKGNTNAGNPPGTGTGNEEDVYLTNRFHGVNSYSDGATHILATLPVTITNGTIRIECVVCAYDVTANLSSSLRFDATFRVSAGVNTGMPTFDIIIQEDAAFTYGTANLNAATPGQITMDVSGQNGNTIKWSCVGTYVQAGT